MAEKAKKNFNWKSLANQATKNRDEDGKHKGGTYMPDEWYEKNSWAVSRTGVPLSLEALNGALGGVETKNAHLKFKENLDPKELKEAEKTINYFKARVNNFIKDWNKEYPDDKRKTPYPEVKTDLTKTTGDSKKSKMLEAAKTKKDSKISETLNSNNLPKEPIYLPDEYYKDNKFRNQKKEPMSLQEMYRVGHALQKTGKYWGLNRADEALDIYTEYVENGRVSNKLKDADMLDGKLVNTRGSSIKSKI